MRGLANLLRLFSARYLARHKLRTALGFCAIALAVALYVSSATANAGIVTSAERTARDLAGSAEWVVARSRSGPIDAAILEKIRALPGAIAAPIVQVSATIPGKPPESLLIFGVDFQSDAMLRLYRVAGTADPATFVRTAFTPNAVIVSRAFAGRRGLAIGSRLPVNAKEGVRDLDVTGVLEDIGPARAFAGGFAIMSLGAAQRIFGTQGVFDRIEVAGVTRAALEHALPDCMIEPAGRVRSVAIDAINRLKSFVAIGVIALLVGIFIVYNTVAISVVERTKVIGTLRALGATSRQIQALLILEWLAIGALGSLAGVAGGIVLARFLVRFAANTINTLMLVIDVQEVPIEPAIVATGIVAGVLASLIAAYLPARQAMRVPPVEILRPRSYRLRKLTRRPFLAGVAAFVLWIILTLAFGLNSLMALVSTGLVFVSIALMLPAITARGARALRSSGRRVLGVEGFLGFDNVTKFPDRTALTATALAGTLAMMVASATVVEGFSYGTRKWMDEAFPFELAITASDFLTSIYTADVLPKAALDEVRVVEGVGIAYGVQKAFVEYEGQEVMLLALDSGEFWKAHQQKGLSAWARHLEDPEENRRFQAGEVVHVSRNFAHRFGVEEGRTITLPASAGPASFVVTRVIDDYSWPALLGGVIGIITGLLGGLIPVRLYMLAMTGYLMPISVPWLTLVWALLAALVIGWLASFIPARRAARIDVLEAIGYE